jgi:hypothetical protein
MKQEIGKALLMVLMEPGEEIEDRLNEWYNKYHVPERLSVPGFLSARRFKLCDGEDGPKYLAIFELEDEAVLSGEAYLKLREISKPMNFERPKLQRLVYHQVFPETGAFEDRSGPQ